MATETGRVEAFSDGVFAIAITLLILEIKIPGAGSGSLAGQLLKQWPSYVSFVISFWFIGIMWMNHHRMFTHIRHATHTLLILNLLLLFSVCIVPFPTAVLAQHLGQPDQRAAAILYNATYFFVAIAFNLLWRYAALKNRQLLGPDADRSAVQQQVGQYAVGPVMYLLCFALSWVSVSGSLVLNALLAGFFALPPDVAWRTKQERTLPYRD